MKKLTLTLLVLLSFTVFSPEAFAARAWVNGWELNSIPLETDTQGGAAMSVQTGTVRSGTYAMQVNSLSSGTRSAFYKNTSGAGGLTSCRFYLNIATYPSAENSIAELTTALTVVGYRITLDNVGVLRAYNADGTVRGSNSATIPLNTWVRIETTNSTSGTDTENWSLNGTNFASYADGNITGTANGLGLGGNINAEAQTTGKWFFDDIECNTDTTAIGDSSLVALHPNAAGDNSACTVGGSSPIASPNEWNNLSEVTPNDAINYCQFTVIGNFLDMNMDDFTPSASAIAAVWVGFRAQPLTNASMSLTARLKSQAGGTVISGTATPITGTLWVTNDDTAASSIYKLIRTTDTQAGGAWTVPLLNSMQVGMGSTDVTPNPLVTAMWAYVEYTPSATVVTTPMARLFQTMGQLVINNCRLVF